MGKKKKSTKQLLREQFKKNEQSSDWFKPKPQVTKKTIYQMTYIKPHCDGVNIKNPSFFDTFTIRIKKDINEITEEEILSMLDFHRKSNRTYRETATKLKIFNKISTKSKDIIRINKEKILIDRLIDMGGCFILPCDIYEEIMNTPYPDDKYTKDKMIRESLTLYFAFYMTHGKPLTRGNFRLYDSEIHRAYLMIKYYFDYNDIEYITNDEYEEENEEYNEFFNDFIIKEIPKVFVKIKLKKQVIEGFKKKLIKIENNEPLLTNKQKILLQKQTQKEIEKRRAYA